MASCSMNTSALPISTATCARHCSTVAEKIGRAFPPPFLVRSFNPSCSRESAGRLARITPANATFSKSSARFSSTNCAPNLSPQKRPLHRTQGRLEEFHKKICRPPFPRSRLRLRQLPRHHLSRTPPAWKWKSSSCSTGASSKELDVQQSFSGRRGSVLRHRDRGMARAYCRSRPLADGPPDEPAVYLKHSAGSISACRSRNRRISNTATRSAWTGKRSSRPNKCSYVLGNPPFVGKHLDR